MECGDFSSGNAWCRYKFEREIKNEEIERLQARVGRAEENLHDLLVYDMIVLVILLLMRIAELAGWI
mgnify:CR=1 FL=1